MNKNAIGCILTVAFLVALGVASGHYFWPGGNTAPTQTSSADRLPTVDLAPNPGEPVAGSASVPLQPNEVELSHKGYILTEVDANHDDGELPFVTTTWLAPEGAPIAVYMMNGRVASISDPDSIDDCYVSDDELPLDTVLAAGPEAVARSAAGWQRYKTKTKDGYRQGDQTVNVDGESVEFTCFHDMSG